MIVITPSSGSSIQLLIPAMRNCCSVDSVLLMDMINVSTSCNSISLIVLKTGRIRRYTVDSANILQQRHRSALECALLGGLRDLFFKSDSRGVNIYNLREKVGALIDVHLEIVMLFFSLC